MPEINIQHVVSYSSADKNHPAENLLKADGTHKWKGAAAGEANVSAVLQLGKSSIIHSIDVGNEGSAFVEILVGKATASSNTDFEVLLVASSFMSPLESRNGTNRNNVRMFGPEKLNKTIATQHWDRVKIVCSQPFSKLQQYGLSFIKFHSPPSVDEKKQPQTKRLGAFVIKDKGDDEIEVGSLFANRGKQSATVTPKGAAAIRAASRIIEGKEKSTPTPSSSAEVVSEKKRPASPPLAYNSPKAKVARTEADSDTEPEESEDTRAPKPRLQKQSTSLSSVASSVASSTKSDKSPLKRNKTEPSRESPAVAFGKLMEKVVFVLSGFQNPYRGKLRDKAIEMGAKYRPDWGKGCTHLICAFSNTPKYQQVQGRGKIVTKDWVLDCHKHKKLLPWRKYRQGDAESPEESSSEDEQPVNKPPPKKNVTPSATKKTADTPKKGAFTYQQSSDSDSGEDTEEEIRKFEAKKNSKDTAALHKDPDPFGDSTDEDAELNNVSNVTDKDTEHTDPSQNDGSDSGLPELPEFFADKSFFFYGDFSEADRRLLTRYIVAYAGEVEDYMSSSVNFVVTSQKWDSNFDDALAENENLTFVKPKWIHTCHQKCKYVPHQPYLVVPN